MALVRVRKGNREFNVGAALAESQELEVLDESAYDHNGAPRPITAKNARPIKEKTSVAEKASEKAAGSASADRSTTTKEK